MQLHPYRLFVLLVASRCFLVMGSRHLSGSAFAATAANGDRHRGLITDQRMDPSRLNIFANQASPHKYHSPALIGYPPSTAEGRYALPADSYYNEDPESWEDGEEGEEQQQQQHQQVTQNEDYNYFADADDYDVDVGGIDERSVDPTIEFEPLCHSELTKVDLDMNVYRQTGYDEITCKHPYERGTGASRGGGGLRVGSGAATAPRRDGSQRHNKICSGAGFTCVQRNRTIYLLKFTDHDSCYATETRTINSSCECVWPKHQLRTIKVHHD